MQSPYIMNILTLSILEILMLSDRKSEYLAIKK